MQDVQNQADSRNLPLGKVGVKNVRYPLVVLDKKDQVQHTTGSIDLFADLPKHLKGTHMSRFIEVFHRYHQHVSIKSFLPMVDQILDALAAKYAAAEIRFPYYLEKNAPISGLAGMMEYDCAYSGEVGQDPHGRPIRRLFVSIRVPVMTLCPCSKEISARGAHNQRGFVSLRLQVGDAFFWIEDIIALVESCASSGLYTLLKRKDELYVTEYSYDHPVFVEDVVRAVAVRLEALAIVPWFSVEAENMESIHNHEAYAFIERGVLQ